jgi:hypothetical protein
MDGTLRVHGAVRRRGDVPLLVLSRRLDGHDTFLHADLTLDPGGTRIRVRVHTFDDVTVLHPAPESALPPGDTWTGRLRLPADRSARAVPKDLAVALRQEGLPADLATLDERERRHLLGYLADATDPATRRARLAAIVAGLRPPGTAGTRAVRPPSHRPPRTRPEPDA